VSPDLCTNTSAHDWEASRCKVLDEDRRNWLAKCTKAGKRVMEEQEQKKKKRRKKSPVAVLFCYFQKKHTQ
jgi:hypothetical protein